MSRSRLPFSSISALCLSLLVTTPAFADWGHMIAKAAIQQASSSASRARDNPVSYQLPATGVVEVAFSPNEGAESLVIKVIDSARTRIQALSYSFTSAPITEAMIRAKRRGVQVQLVADEKNNVSEDRSGKARAALSAMVNAGIDVRTIGVYAIHHDKVLVVDGDTVQLGSFNYSDAAAHRNSENVLVNWHNPKLAQVYLTHFDRNYRQAKPYQLQY